ncbi:ABC transporter permease [Shimazuella kribbensis]|uniref:ABC transporter permease n=1 Tax=Shimazuella kribbensis TaxID=139808 RepID=UPI0003FE87BD|nr:ABC transporter permease [Shimazuella kribbensis]
MLRYTLKRFGLMLLTLFIIVTVTFFLVRMLPGTPLANEEKLPAEIREQILEQYGLKEPLSIQYVKFMGNLVQGDLGMSLSQNGRSVNELLSDRIGPSAFIGFQGIIFGLVVGLLLGIIAALRRGTWIDNVASATAVFGVSIPNFVLAGLLSYWIGVKFELLPPALWGGYEYTILPSLALSVYVIAQVSRYIRTEMVEVLEQDYIRTAKAKGLSWSKIITGHALRNAMIPAVTILGPLTVNILTGSLVVENIFGIPGIGNLFVDSIMVNDYTTVLGTTIFYSVLFLSVTFIVDVLYGVIDPRIRVSGAKE